MNVVQVAPRYPPRTGGVETHVAKVSENLVKCGLNVTVLTADLSSGIPRRENRAGVEVIRHWGVAPNNAFHIAPGIIRTLSSLSPDVVHAHNYHSLPLLFAAIATTDSRFVVTPHYHGSSSSTIRDKLLSLYQPLGGWALSQADVITAVSNWERDRLREDFEVSPIVVPNGIELSRFSDTEPMERERPYLLTVGRLEKYKGIQHVIRALPNLPDYELVVAGSGPYREKLVSIARDEKVHGRVTFLGYVEDDSLPALYAGADAFITMSEFEAYGMTVGEALAAGTPCVVRERGALSEWTDRPDCVGVSGPGPGKISEAVAKAVGRKTNPDSLPSWDDITEQLVAVYSSE